MPLPLSVLTARRDGLILAHDLQSVGGDAWLRKSVRDGGLLRIRHGVYIPSKTWRGMNADAQYATRVRATALTHSDPVFSNFSAASVWGLPIIGRWPDDVFIASSTNAGGRRRAGVVEQTFRGDPGITLHDGVLVTSIARTVVDVCRSADYACAVAMADAALHDDRDDAGTPLCTVAELWKEYESLAPFPGARQCRRVLEFANGLSGSPGESLSRVAMQILGFPPPILQQPFYDAAGLIGIVDFWWPEFNLFGEFDGYGKYLREELLDGETPAQAVIREKKREDRIRAVGPRASRWDWGEALTIQPLKRKLVTAGLPVVTR